MVDSCYNKSISLHGSIFIHHQVITSTIIQMGKTNARAECGGLTADTILCENTLCKRHEISIVAFTRAHTGL